MRKASVLSKTSSLLYRAGGGEEVQEPHFLEACFRCQKQLGHDCDIFMYRGNTPFCCKECRQEQMDIDESREKKSWSLSSSTSVRRPNRATDPNKPSPSKAVQTETVAVAS